MHELFLKLKSFQGFTATMLLMLMVYEFGACPCGCVEHNAWVQLIGLSSAEDAQHSAISVKDVSSVESTSAADWHDCTGETRQQYVNSAYVSRLQDLSSSYTTVLLVATPLSSTDAPHALEVKRLASHPSVALHAAQCRPALQIYLL